SLELLTVDTALSWRVSVPVAWIFAFTTFVVLSGFDWTVPSAFVYDVLLTIVRPCSVSVQVTRPVVLENEQSPSSGPCPKGPPWPNGPSPNPLPKPIPP